LKSSESQKIKVSEGVVPVLAHCFYLPTALFPGIVGARLVGEQFTDEPCRATSKTKQLRRAGGETPQKGGLRFVVQRCQEAAARRPLQA